MNKNYDALADTRSLHDERIMQNRKYKSGRVTLLDGIPVQEIEHFERSLKEHLIGTHDLLDRWGNPEHVCLAGLFHSVYGTKTFRPAALTTKSRGDVRELIGKHAEFLVFIFGMSDRKHLLLENRSAPYFWIDHRTGEQTEIAVDIFNELVEIEVANFVDQLPFRSDKTDSVIQDMRHRFESNASRMSVSARDAFRQAIDGRAGSVIASAQQNS